MHMGNLHVDEVNFGRHRHGMSWRPRHTGSTGTALCLDAALAKSNAAKHVPADGWGPPLDSYISCPKKVAEFYGFW